MKYYPKPVSQPFGENTVITSEASILPQVFGYNLPSGISEIVIDMVDDAKRLVDFDRVSRRFSMDDDLEEEVSQDLDDIKHRFKVNVVRKLEAVEKKYL